MGEHGLGYLYYSVLGESILNDAVALTLFSSFSKIVEEGTQLTGDMALPIFFDFCKTFSGSMLIGVVGGIAATLVLKLARLGPGSSPDENFYFNVPELGVALVCAYLPFLAAAAVDLSGITAIMFAGITMRHYAHYNMTQVTRQVFLPIVEFFASLCETYVFVLLGLGVLLLSSDYSASLMLWAGAACLVGRAAHVYPLSWAVNLCSSSQPLNHREQHVVWFAGLRGAVAFMCALGFPENPQARHHNQILSTTIVLAGVSILVLGWPTTAVLRCLDIRSQSVSQLSPIEHGSPRHPRALVVDEQPARRFSCSMLLNSGAAILVGERVRKILMTSEAVIRWEVASQRSSELSPQPRVSLGVPVDGVWVAAGGGTSALQPVSGISPNLQRLLGVPTEGPGASSGGGTPTPQSALVPGPGHASPNGSVAPRGSMSSVPHLSRPTMEAIPLPGAPSEACRSTRMLCDP